MPAAMQSPRLLFFFFNDTATTEIYTLSLHDALPICRACRPRRSGAADPAIALRADGLSRSEEHTSELQSRSDIVCRLLLEKKRLNVDEEDESPLDEQDASKRSFHTLPPTSPRKIPSLPRENTRPFPLFFLMIRQPPRSPFFPATAPFR